jgi:hypothetical protein
MSGPHTRQVPTRVCFPTTTELCSAPERAILAALDASLLLGIRALRAAHPPLAVPKQVLGRQPLLLLGESILATASSLRELLAGYEALVDGLTGPEYSCAVAAPCTPAPADCTPDDDDIPF